MAMVVFEEAQLARSWPSRSLTSTHSVSTNAEPVNSLSVQAPGETRSASSRDTWGCSPYWARIARRISTD